MLHYAALCYSMFVHRRNNMQDIKKKRHIGLSSIFLLSLSLSLSLSLLLLKLRLSTIISRENQLYLILFLSFFVDFVFEIELESTAFGDRLCLDLSFIFILLCF